LFVEEAVRRIKFDYKALVAISIVSPHQ